MDLDTDTTEMTSNLHYENTIEKGADLLSCGKHKEAIQYFRTVLDCSPDNPLANYNCGIAHYGLL